MDRLIVQECPRCGYKSIHRVNKLMTFCERCNYAWDIKKEE
ncbi:MAG: hypothetical protein ACOC1K_01740 [Nanoarchaeota archaeon]